MTSVADHRARLVALLDGALAAARAETETIAPAAALADDPTALVGRVLGEPVRAAGDLPPFDNAQMDGWAVRAADLADATPEHPVRLEVTAEIPAGETGRPLAAGQAAPIMTGAPVPAGADAIVPVEDGLPARFLAPGEQIALPAPVPAGTYVRRRGGDLPTGALVLPEGHPLDAGEWAAIAAAGHAAVRVRRRPRVLVVSTGRELAAGPAGIPDADLVALAVALTGAGCAVRSLQQPHDDPERLAAALDARVTALAPDLVVTAGGISAGAHEVVRQALEPRGLDVGVIAMQPGGPQGTGPVRLGGRDVAVIALPGNPVSVLVSLEVLVLPALRAVWTGAPEPAPRLVPLAEGVVSPAGREQYRRIRLRDTPTGPVAVPVGGPGSHLIAAYPRADALARIPAERTAVAAGEPVEIRSIHGLHPDRPEWRAG